MSEAPFFQILKKSRFDYKTANYYKIAYEKIVESGLFDFDYYLQSYNDVKNSGMDPLVHYLFHGYKEGKLPSLYFNQDSYLKKHPNLDENPLIHYINNEEEGFINKSNPMNLKKNKIIATNKALLNNFEIENEPLVSIIIPNRNGLHHLKRLFKDFDKKTNYSNYEIIVVDNASSDNSIDYLKSLDLPIKIIENKENQSFSKVNNEASKIANGELLLFLNNDIEPTYGWLNELVGEFLKKQSVKAVGAKLVFPEMEESSQSFSLQHGGIKFREEITPYTYGPYHENIFNTLIFNPTVNVKKEVVGCSAACLLVDKKIFEELDGFDENYYYGYEDVDFAFKMHDKGYKTVYNPQALLFHHESATRKENIAEKNNLNFQNIMYFYNKWKNKLFKEILKDKLNQNNFFTNKKLSFTIIGNESNEKFIKDLNKKYNVKLIKDLNNFDLGSDCDVLISFNENYDISKIIARNNLIKILVSNKDNNDYDLVLEDENKILDTLEDMVS